MPHTEDNSEEYVVEEVLQIEKCTTVSRVRHNNNSNRAVIMKSNTKLLNHPRKIIKYYQEFIIGSSVKSPFVVRYVDFKKFDHGYALLMEDIGGTALTELLNYKKEGLPLDIFLEVACKITKGIGAIHAAGVIHKDINPANIVYCESTGELNIIDFGIASQLSKNEILPTSIPFGDKDVDKAHDKGVEMEGSLLYISPEQTGRMNRVVDYRSDFYSLGVTFYELLSGVPPFTQSCANTYIDLVYKHLAVHPRSILEIRPEVGSALWNVVAKLMAKNAEDRYQDYKGLLYDLQDIQKALEKGLHENMPDFVAGSRDLAMHLQVSQKLYGREEEVRKLTRNFEQVCSEGSVPSMLMLVHGYSGVGKTLIVNEVHRPLAKSYGNYISGKFDQFLSASPYSAIIQALKQLIQQILTESETSLKEWQHRLESGLKGNGKLMTDLIPDLELVIGPQAEVPILEAVENVHRFKDVFVGFISSLACKERPLVIFLDDLQWADSNTLNLLLALLTNREASRACYLLIVGAYRDNEVNENHPLSVNLREIRSKGGIVEDVSVSALREEQVVQLLDDTFNTNHNAIHKLEVEPLGKLVYKKTQGNPFFVNQLLTTLYKNGHIHFESVIDDQSSEPARGGWMYDMEAIQEENYTSNVVDLMVSMLRKLPQAVQHMVGVAATIGNQVELWLLAVACNTSEYEARNTLNGAISEGYLIPRRDEFIRNVTLSAENPMDLERLVFPEMSTSSSSLHMTYRFAHDRVQQAAAQLISQEDRRIVHGKIAEKLLSRFSKDAKDFSNYLLRIATHMNQSFDESTLEYDIHDEADEEKKYSFPFCAVRIAEVNYKAAIKAKNANAFQQALAYAELGATLLAKEGEKAWGKYQVLAFDIHKLYLDLQVLTGSYSAADATYALLLPHATSLQAKTDVHIAMFHRFELEHRLAEAIDTAAQALALYGFSLPMDAEQQERAFLADIELIDKNLEKFNNLSELLDLPECVDVFQHNVIKLLMAAWPATYMLGKRFLCAYLSSQGVLRSMQHGVCAETGMALVSYVWFSRLVTDEYVKLNELARVGLSMLDLRYPHQKALRGFASLLYATGVSVWGYPLIKSLPYIEMAFELNNQAGNLDFMAFSALYIVDIPFMSGEHLSKPALEYEKREAFWKEGNFGIFPYMEAIAQPIWDLQGVQRDFLQGQKYEDSMYPKDAFLNVGYNFAKLVSSFFLRNDMAKWLHYADTSASVIPVALMGLYKVSEMETVVSLLFLDWLGRSPMAREICAPKSALRCEPEDSDADIKSEEEQTREQQKAALWRRIEMVKSSIENLSLASLKCKANFEHKVHLLKAEASRVALTLNSDAIFSSKISSTSPSSSPRNSEYNIAQGFEDTIELYESAIKGAKQHGFKQYEALGLELYGRFWLTSKIARPRIALLYLTDAILAYERWGATEKARLLSDECVRLTRNDPTSLYSMDSPPRKKTSTSVFSLDLETIVQASQTICNETDISALTVKMVKTIVENANAERGTFFVVNEDESHPSYAYKDSLMIAAEYDYEQAAQRLEGSSTEVGVVLCDPKQPLGQWSNGPISLVRLVGRTRKAVVLDCAYEDAQFGSDKYISEKEVKSVICMPIILNNALKGIMYLENNLCEGMYTQNRVDLLTVLTSQMAISLENIKFLHEQIREQSEKMRFEQLQREEAAQRERADAAEKYKVQLENFIDMICHEIRNPLNGIFGNTDLITHYLNNFEAIQQKQGWMNLPVLAAPSSALRSSTSQIQPLPHLPILRVNAPNSPVASQPSFRHFNTSSSQPHPTISQDSSVVDGGETYGSFIEQIRSCTATIQSCAEHQKRMTDDVLQLSRLRSHKLEILNSYYRPWEMVQTTLRAFGVQANNKGLELRLESKGLDERSEIYGDNIRIHQILSNLLSNAIKFTLQGSITVTVSIDDTSEKDNNMAQESPSISADHIGTPHLEGSEKVTVPCIFTLQVVDTGIGMNDKEQGRIFKRFSQANNRTSKEYGGSGLGLSICRKLAKLMNGTISLESEARKGSTFTVQLHCKRISDSSLSSLIPPEPLSPQPTNNLELPISPAEAGEQEEAKGEGEKAKKPTKPQRILVSEDNLMNQTLLARVLPLKGYLVDITSNGEEGLNKYKEHQRREAEGEQGYYSFVLMDIQMPVMDGLVATELIRKFETENDIPPIVIIGLSGNARDEYRQTALASGMNEYITKPHHKEVLYAALEKKWDGTSSTTTTTTTTTTSIRTS